jgi:AFG3 family protein
MSNSNKDKKSNMPKFKFNSYWIYGAVILAIFAIQFFSSGDLASKSISKNKFDEILQDNDIKKIVVINRDVA